MPNKRRHHLSVCGNAWHSLWNGNAELTLLKIHSGKIKADVLKFLNEKQFLKEKCQNICDLCVTKATEYIEEDEPQAKSPKADQQKDDEEDISSIDFENLSVNESLNIEVDKVCDALINDLLDEDQELKLYHALAVNIKNKYRSG
ncbi:unnamed protein product [Didymodactylos carnosus]|uniref:Uncharacterized protein n=1 Tax=Didymodactylos carnosus TaxID=1234261 RepID=A0A814YT10_9BILA|nr:unnamed protein product [Didymodactylos carnosus]CAF1636240.1 unnamed protein product [Didymodactylos carnosus]CAF3995252.1 unnamed protein product [Didymodactylos carnosus]CAF4467607.1 unnamed protein product [Didymodactylos carnosus]